MVVTRQERQIVATRHFNGLTESEQERLVVLSEECGEVVQAAAKVLRHGYDSTPPSGGENNRKRLMREIGDVMWAVSRMERIGDLNPLEISTYADTKEFRAGKYLHHQEGK